MSKQSELDGIIQYCNYMETTGEPGICHWCGERQTSDLHTLKKKIIDWHNKQVKEAERRAYKQGWDSAGGELTDVKEQIEEVLDRLEVDFVSGIEKGRSHSFTKTIEAERNRLKEPTND